MAVRSSMLRAAGSKLLTPRSHRITFSFPSARMYSALRSMSLMVAAIPRLSSTGFFILPTVFSSE